MTDTWLGRQLPGAHRSHGSQSCTLKGGCPFLMWYHGMLMMKTGCRLWMWSNKHCLEMDNCSPQAPGCAGAKDSVGHLCCEGLLPTRTHKCYSTKLLPRQAVPSPRFPSAHSFTKFLPLLVLHWLICELLYHICFLSWYVYKRNLSRLSFIP